MIPRYTMPEMGKIWTEESRFKRWLEVEIASLEGWSSIGVIPHEAVESIKAGVKLDIQRINEIEKITNHDVIAFVEQIGETAGKYGGYIHYGLTSSDVIDTALALQLREAGNILLDDLKTLIASLKDKALLYRETVMMGRTHGVHGEPLTLGFKIAGWREEFARNLERLEYAVKNISVGKLSGAVGTFSNIDPRVEEYVCKKFALEREAFSTQIISRDRHVFFLTVLGIIAASCEKIALQVRLLQQTEIAELAEPFGKGQKGSSAMPHKRNPILCERICGIARVIKNNTGAALENMALWHERDISHSSAERIIFPESTILLDYILQILTRVVKNIDVFDSNMEKNVKINRNVFFSQTLLNTLVMKGVSRKDAYEIIQKKSFEAIKLEKDFTELIKSSPEIKEFIGDKELESIFDIKYLLRNTGSLFDELN